MISAQRVDSRGLMLAAGCSFRRPGEDRSGKGRGTGTMASLRAFRECGDLAVGGSTRRETQGWVNSGDTRAVELLLRRWADQAGRPSERDSRSSAGNSGEEDAFGTAHYVTGAELATRWNQHQEM